MRFEVAVPARGRGWLRRASRCFVARALYGPWRLTFVVRKERRGHLVAQLKSAAGVVLEQVVRQVTADSTALHARRSHPRTRAGLRFVGSPASDKRTTE
jgi:hypothetical protein